MKKTILTGFSLIEILVSLIIISLITAAFVPVITKKLSISSMVLNGSISGGGSGNNSGGNHTGNNTLPSLIKSQEDCDKIANSLIFLSQEQNGGKAACVTKANVGDTYRYGPEISSATGVTIVNSGASCGSGDNSKCCWLGNIGESTSNYCEDNGNGDSTYSGCKRTVCTWAAAKSVCENWEPVEGTKGKWRLPKNEELAAWGRSISAINRNQGFAGLQLCDRYSGYGSVQCMGYKACLGTTDGMCNPLYVWSGTEASSNQARYYYLQSGNFSADYDSINRAFSARCVLDEDSWKETTGATEPKDPDQEIPDPNQPFYGSLPTDITSQSDCDKLARNLYFISAENNGGVAACVTKANVGDTYMYGPEISVSADVSVVNAGSICGSNTIDDKCCWLGNNIGQTSGDGCNDNNGGYSGCKRTVCTWEAAVAACENWAPVDETKGFWRLPRYDELKVWASKLDTISVGKGTNGLQFCNSYSSSGCASCPNSTLTQNPNSRNIAPSYVWGFTTGADQGSGVYALYSSSIYTASKSYGLSTRCMIDATAIKNINKQLNNSFSLPNQITSQNDCDKLGVNLLYIPAEYNYDDAACVTKANMGDTNAFGAKIPTSAGVTVVNSDQTCGSSNNYSAKCCWKTITAHNYSNNAQINSNYSSYKRTVCTWAAADSICSNFEPVARTKGRWRLPDYNEYYKWFNFNIKSDHTGKNELQICSQHDTDITQSYISDCLVIDNACQGSAYINGSDYVRSGYCGLGHYWTSTKSNNNTNNTAYFIYEYDSGLRNSNEYIYSSTAASVRCMITDSTIRGINNHDNIPDTISSQADCNKLGRNLLYLTSEQNGGVAACVTKINVGDTYMNGPAIDSRANVTIKTPTDDYSGGYCYAGNNVANTANSSRCGMTGNGNSTYSGCRRMVCGRDAASNSCKYLETVAGTKGYWRLPTQSEATAWASKLSEIQLNKGTSGLQLCDGNSNSNGSVQCSYYSDKYPNAIWISNGTYSYSQAKLNDGVISIDSSTSSAASTRCILDQTALTKIKNWEAP